MVIASNPADPALSTVVIGKVWTLDRRTGEMLSALGGIHFSCKRHLRKTAHR